jgi:hypothetical protein
MPIRELRAWKEIGISPEERIDRFFNVIDHALEIGIPLDALYRRQHLKNFILYALKQVITAEETHVAKLTLTSSFASSITIGDPSYMTFTLAPKETKSLDVTEVQIRQLTPGLEKLKAAGWLNYSIVTNFPNIKVESPPPPAPSVPVAAPEEVVTKPVAEVTEKPAAEPVEVPAQETTPPVPVAARPLPFDRKNRNR